uniref:NADH dehydrogenase subunit 1 n=1 Tax=Tetragonula iridipennis TaxID=597212 RepID=UPI0026E2B82B|nr:NADH dehydrogenase subunit 1 [Tetragonula iridipennis]WJQ22765.1 NADH dehydrogenase subunit 1 [Tetragonula iridipennis]
MFMMINLMIMILMIMISVAFLTLFERKILSYMQYRKGPNKLFYKGILQPFSDMIKLLTKEMFGFSTNYMFYYSPMLMFIISSILWLMYPWYFNNLNLKHSMLFLIFIISLNVYPILMVSWISTNNYSMISSMRMVSQVISFEVLMYMMMFILMMLFNSYSMFNSVNYQVNIKLFFFAYPMYFMFILSLLVDLNRAPFDLVEGESELVSGFNVEYYSSLFTMIFLSEYMNMIFMSMILVVLFYGLFYWNFLFNMFFIINLVLIVMMRGVLPRIRYDYLMYTCWMELLVLMTYYLIYFYLFKELIMMMNM